MVTEALAEIAEGADLVAGIDARGFLLGGAVAHRLGIGVLAIRKGGKLPPPVHSQTYALEYGTATLEIPADGIDLAGRRVAIIDDVLATGGTVAAARDLLVTGGAEVTGGGGGAGTVGAGRTRPGRAAAGAAACTPSRGDILAAYGTA